MKFRTQRVPPYTITGVVPVVHVRLDDVRDGNPQGAAQKCADLFQQLAIPQEDYCIWLNRYGGAWHERFRLSYPFVLADMEAWNVPNTRHDAEAIAWWRNWTEQYVEEMDRLDQTPHSFLMDTERPLPADSSALTNRISPAMDQSFWQVVRAKWQGIRCGNWREESPDTFGDVQCPRLYHNVETNKALIRNVPYDKPVVPWILHPCGSAGLGGSGVPGEWQTIQTIAACMARGITEFQMWGSTNTESWDALARVVEVIEGIRG